MRIFLGLALAVMAAPGYCATFSSLSALALATATDAEGFLIASDSEFDDHYHTMTLGRSVSAQADLKSEGFDLSGKAAGDIRSGALSAAAEKGAGFGEVLSSTGFYEEFTARGSGQVTFRMDLSGYWETDLPRPGPDAWGGFDLWSSVHFEGPDFFRDSSEYFVRPFDAAFQPSGKVSHSLTYSAMVADGSTYGVAGGIHLIFVDTPSIGTVTGSAALNGIFSYAAGDGVRLEFVDPEFMVAPVPLPAGWMLLVGAIGAAWTLRGPLRRLPRAA